MPTMKTPCCHNVPGFLSRLEDVPIVFGANRILDSVKLSRISRDQTEKVRHDKAIVSPGHAKGADTSKRWIELFFVGYAGVKTDPGAELRSNERFPGMP
jgi:hypothetical protein